MPFDTVPSNATLKPSPFKVDVPEAQLQDLKHLVQTARIGPKTWENSVTDVKSLTSFGIQRDWLAQRKEQWGGSYSWRKAEERINRIPNYKAKIEDSGFTFEVHFAALFSKKKDAVPLLFLHGWPGSFLEFLGTLEEFSSKYDENSLPYHIVVPSLPGYCFSNGPPLDKDWLIEDTARIMDTLMKGLGFESGYIAQGGDLGSYIARVVGVTSASAKAVHLNLCIGVMPENDEEEKKLAPDEQAAVRRARDFTNMGSAYARFHGQRPATVGLILSTNPLALLAWIGEKFLQWSDDSPPDEEILDSLTLWWLTESFPRAIYPYRQPFGRKPSFFHPEAEWYIKKPLGYSWFPKDLAPIPVPLVAKTGNLVWSRKHGSGGHFAAMERPKAFVSDIEDFVKQVWEKPT